MSYFLIKRLSIIQYMNTDQFLISTILSRFQIVTRIPIPIFWNGMVLIFQIVFLESFKAQNKSNIDFNLLPLCKAMNVSYSTNIKKPNKQIGNANCVS